jgi:NRPS condensation-like uncharacterized protein
LFIIAPASYAQVRIWQDQQNQSGSNKPQLAINNMPFVYSLNSGKSFSTKQLRQALQLIVKKHQPLRTSLIFDEDNNILMQRLINLDDNNNQLFVFIERAFKTDEELNEIIHNEKSNCQLFDLSQGVVFRCHTVYYNEISSKGLVSDKDAIIFNFHHAAFDILSMDVFLQDLNEAYTTGQLTTDDDDTSLRYLDCEYKDISLFFDSNHTSSLCII